MFLILHVLVVLVYYLKNLDWSNSYLHLNQDPFVLNEEVIYDCRRQLEYPKNSGHRQLNWEKQFSLGEVWFLFESRPLQALWHISTGFLSPSPRINVYVLWLISRKIDWLNWITWPFSIIPSKPNVQKYRDCVTPTGWDRVTSPVSNVVELVVE